MADRILFVGWGTPIPGREERALEVFEDSMGFYGRCQQDGRIEAFRVILLEPHGGELGGYVELHGSPGQLAAMREDEEFQRLLVDAGLIVNDLGVVGGVVNEGVAEQLGFYRDAIAKLPNAVAH